MNASFFDDLRPKMLILPAVRSSTSVFTEHLLGTGTCDSLLRGLREERDVRLCLGGDSAVVMMTGNPLQRQLGFLCKRWVCCCPYNSPHPGR